MITVSSSEYSVSAEGHAGYAPYGQDIVCSAVSILMSTAAEEVDRLGNENKLEKKTIHIESGNAYVSCIPKKGHEAETGIIFEVIRAGLIIISDLYPENVMIKK